MSLLSNKYARYYMPPLVILIGILIMAGLVASRKKPQKKEIETVGALVEVTQAKIEQRFATITSTGTVKPRYEVALTPQVMGKITWISPRLETGGEFAEGDSIIRIEPTDYLLAVQQAEAMVAQAQYQFDVAKANADIARQEWDLIQSSNKKLLKGTSTQAAPDPLVLHEPQLRQAQANLKSAKASLDGAKLSLDRTLLVAPFNCKVRSHNAAVGQVIGTSGPVASLYATDLVEIEVGLPLKDLAWLSIPGAKATVKLNTGDAIFKWNGRVDRSTGVLDQIGRLARVVVQVQNPFSSKARDLDIGAFVTVELKGKEIMGTIPVPRVALRENNTVWVVDENDELSVRDVHVHHMTPSEVMISEGLSEGDQVILTSLTGAANGMKLRIATNGGGE